MTIYIIWCIDLSVNIAEEKANLLFNVVYAGQNKKSADMLWNSLRNSNGSEVFGQHGYGVFGREVWQNGERINRSYITSGGNNHENTATDYQEHDGHS